MREAADHSCSESHQAENVSLKPYTRRWTNPVLNSALFVLGVHTAGVIVWSELKADNTLTLFVVYKFWAFLLNKQTNKINHCDYFHLLHLKDWSASKICLLRETIFRLWNSASDVSNYGFGRICPQTALLKSHSLLPEFSPWMSLECLYLGSNITLPQGKL